MISGIVFLIYKQDYVISIIYFIGGILFAFSQLIREKRIVQRIWAWCKNHIEDILSWIGIGIAIILVLRAFGTILRLF